MKFFTLAITTQSPTILLLMIVCAVLSTILEKFKNKTK